MCPRFPTYGPVTRTGPYSFHARPAVSQPIRPNLREVRLHKGKRSLILRWAAGDERQVMAYLLDVSKATQRDFDWFDAVILWHAVQRDASERGDDSVFGLGDLPPP